MAAGHLLAQNDDEDEEDFVRLPPGILAVYRSPGGEHLLRRMEPVPRLFGGGNDSPHPKVPAAGFRVSWRGRLLVPYDGQYTFWLNRSTLGDVKFMLGGDPVRPGEPIELQFGNLPLELSGANNGGKQEFELAWENELFAKEIVHPRFFGHLPAEVDGGEIAVQGLEDSGAALSESFGCFRCHQGPAAWTASLGAGLDPKLLLPGPRLNDAGRRLHRAWLKNYLTDPAAHRPGTRMPIQFGDTPADRAALEVIVAYLGSGQTAEMVTASPKGSAKNGQKLYTADGCAACHEPPEGTISTPGAPLRVPSLDRLAEKWAAAGLASFLASPLVSRPCGRMPDFALSAQQAKDVAAYLLGRDGAGQAPAYVALPKGEGTAKTDPGAMIDTTGNLLRLGLEESSGNLTDGSGGGHHGVAVGKLAYGRQGHNGGALGFDGRDGHIVIEGSKEFSNNADFTWSAWIKTTQGGAVFGRARQKGGWIRGGKTLFVRDGKLCFDVGFVGCAVSKTPVNDGRWHYVAVTATFNTKGNNDKVVLYVDGRPDVVKDNWNVDKFPENDLVLKLGRCSDGFPKKSSFDGLIDEATAWSRALDEGEIGTLSRGESHLADTEAALFKPGQLKARWVSLGEDPRQFDKFGAGMRLRSVALRLMARQGCLNCHDAGLQPRRQVAGSPRFDASGQPPPAPPLDRLLPGRREAGCLAVGPSQGKAPRFDFSDAERAALAAYVVSLPSRSWRSLAESLSIDLKLLNCTTCHDDEGTGGRPLAALLGGSDKARYLMPHSLAGVAGRLRAERLDEYLHDGTRLHRTRPWLGARMPGFGQRGLRVAAGLRAREHVSPGEPFAPPAELSPAQVEMGRTLVSTKGLTCVNCHPVNGQRPSGEIDETTRAPDLGMLAEHVRPEHFRRLLRNPDRVFPGTKMPVIFPKDGPAPLPGMEKVSKEVLRQALWSYLSLGKKAPRPLEEDPLGALRNMLRIRVQRGPTFAGGRLYGRGISCGFPTGTAMFDADRLELAAIWFEGFLNPRPTNYFGMNWAVPGSHQILSTGQHALAWQGPDSGRWQVSPMPLECDPNTAARFDGYTVGQTEVAFRYRLWLAGRRVPVTAVLRIDTREAWRGLVEELTLEDLPRTGRLAWTLPEAAGYELLTAAGQQASPQAGPAEAPLVVYSAGKRRCAIRVAAGPGWKWQTDGKLLRLVSPGNSRADPLRLRIDRWTYRREGAMPSAAELAGLCDPELLEPPPLEKGPQPTPAKRISLSNGEPEEPFTYRFEQIPGPPGGWRPSGAAFTSDKMLYVCGLTKGTVWRTMIPPAPAPEKVDWRLYAAGLNVPTGMNVIDDRLLVAHRPETTELIDADGDGYVEHFRTVTGPWSLKAGFHEYNFGLAVDPQKKMFSAMNNGYFWSYGGPTNRGRHRSAVMRYDLEGNSEEWGRGCRVPNGIACGPQGQPFYVDNQGDWVQVCKLVHCRKGLFYGHPETKQEFLPEGEVPGGLPAVWIPYNVIRSAAALCYDDTQGKCGPFAGQMFTGDCGYGKSVNIMRMALEKVEGVYQGAAFRFIDGKPSGPQHAVFGPDGQMYVCCLTDGLMRLRYGGKVPMEIHRVNMRRDGKGFVLHFTKPLDGGAELGPESVRVRRWWYPYGIRYGSPRHEQRDVPVEGLEISTDRKSIDLSFPIETYKNCMVYYFNVDKLKSAGGRPVEHPEAWYTVQRVWK